MNDYEAEKQAKRERYAERARKASAEASEQRHARAAIMARIPMGQPILIGHHSEKKHRRDLARIDANTSRAIDAESRAAYYAHKAETYGAHGISDDDPSATSKLENKIAELEAKRARIKADGRGAHPRYVLSNLGANIRRYKKRLEALKRAADTPAAEPVQGDGYRLEEHKGANRIRFYFDGKPEPDVRRMLKRHGFRWAPSVGAWQRQLNNAGRYAAECVARGLS